MKGVVMEKNEKHMVIMKNDGTFEKVNTLTEADIGQEVTINETPPVFKKIYKYACVAAAVVLLLIGGLNVKTYYTPYGYISIDINPSIQLAFNKFERVIDVKPLNNDGNKVVQDVKELKNTKLDEATQNIIESAYNQDYIKDDTNNKVMLSVYTPDSEKKYELKNRVRNVASSYAKSRNKDVEVISESATKNDVDKAKINNMSVGKLKLYEKVKKVNSDITLEEFKKKPVREVVKLINKSKNKNKSDRKKNNNRRKNNDKLDNPSETKRPEFENKIKRPKGNKENLKKPTIEDAKNQSLNKGFNKNNSIPKIESKQKVDERINKMEDRINEIENHSLDKNQDEQKDSNFSQQSNKKTSTSSPKISSPPEVSEPNSDKEIYERIEDINKRIDKIKNLGR